MIVWPRLSARIGVLVVVALGLAACSTEAPRGAAASQSPMTSDPTAAEGLDQELVEAAYAGDVEKARALIQKGADVNAKDETQQSAYLIATSEVGDDPALLELTLANGADVDAKDSFNGTGLIRAADRGHVTICRRLIEAGVDIDHVNNLGWTALLEAVILGGGDKAHQDVVALLVDSGADRSIKDPNGDTALEIARDRGYTEMVALLS